MPPWHRLFVVFNELSYPGDSATFDSRSGPLIVVRKERQLLELDFPALETSVGTDQPIIEAVTAALGTKPQWLGRTPFDLLAVLGDAEQVKSVAPNTCATRVAVCLLGLGDVSYTNAKLRK